MKYLAQRMLDDRMGSLPLRECGLKYCHPAAGREVVYVTPLAGVWIEIIPMLRWTGNKAVTPLAGVWIEINVALVSVISLLSLPLRECGLK